MYRLKTEHNTLYQRLIMNIGLHDLSKSYPSPTRDQNGKIKAGNLKNLKSHFALATVRLEINSKLFSLSRYLTWMYVDEATDPVERMLQNSVVRIIHQDNFLIDDTLQAIAELFEKAVRWDNKTESLDELKRKVALFRFTYAHCMPCCRGDGAIGDWLELALYRFHGFVNTEYNHDKLACFETLSSLSLSRYLKRYNSIIDVK
jgi:hypothetical protein